MREEIEAWFWNIWIVQWLKFLPVVSSCFFFNLSYLQRITGDQCCRNTNHKNSNPSKKVSIFLSARVLPLLKILPEWARNSAFWFNFYEFLDYIKIRHICHALPYIASLVKFVYKFCHIWGIIPWKNRSKIFATLTFEGLCFENCCLEETYLGYVTLWSLLFGVKLGAQIEDRQRAWSKILMISFHPSHRENPRSFRPI